MAKKEKDTRWRVLDIFENGVKAEIAKGFLEENGIMTILRDSTSPYGGDAYFGQSGPKELLVAKEDEEEARRLLKEKNKE